MKKHTVVSPPVNLFEDSFFVAFLSYRGHQFKPFRQKNGRVVFEVVGDIAHDVEAFYQNQGVGVLEFINHVKAVRNSIFTLRNMHREG